MRLSRSVRPRAWILRSSGCSDEVSIYGLHLFCYAPTTYIVGSGPPRRHGGPVAHRSGTPGYSSHLSLRVRKVLLVGPYPPPFGGPNVHMLHLRRQLERVGIECKVLNIGPSRRQTVPGTLPVPSGRALVFQVATWARRGYRIHHFFNVESPKAIVLAALASTITRMLGGRYSIGFVGGPRQRYLDRRSSFWGRVFARVLYRTDFVVCNNESVKRVLQGFCRDTEKFHAIQCFHPAQVGHVGVAPEPIRTFLDKHAPALSSVVSARYETPLPHHEVSVLIDAVQRLRDRHPRIGCVVMGASECIEHYQAMVTEAELQDHFHFGGEVPHESCLATMRECDVFVRAYIKDGNSSSVREALALAVPTVASRNPQHPDEVISFEPNDGGSLAAVLIDTFDHLPQIRTRLRRNGDVTDRAMESELALFGARQLRSHDP